MYVNTHDACIGGETNSIIFKANEDGPFDGRSKSSEMLKTLGCFISVASAFYDCRIIKL